MLRELADALGIMAEYRDTTGQLRLTSAETIAALLPGFGIDPGDEAACARALAQLRAPRALPVWEVVDQGQAAALPALEGLDWQITCEDGAVLGGQGAELPALPLGIHRLAAGGSTCWLLAAPPRLPDPPRGWGVTLPLYALKPVGQGGIGSYADLARAVAGLGGAGADFAGINPIHAGFPTDPMAFSPYSPSHRRRLSILHVEAGAVPPADGDLIDYPAATAAQMAALEAGFAAPGAEDGLDAFIEHGGAALRRFCTHQALSELHGPYWPDWPAAFRDPASAEVAEFAARHEHRLRFHAWAQMQAERQLAEVRRAGGGMRLGLYLDLAVGTHPAGAETWADPALFARHVSIGAPPDAFSPDGQVWHLAPMRPDILAERGFKPLAETLRAQLRFASLLRIDHILGFDRAFWVPMDRSAPGAYLRMPRRAMLAVARIEAARVGATIIGEDLGNVPDGLRADLAASNLLGCRVAMFERDGPEHAPTYRPAETYDAAALTSWATHDLPSWAGWRAGRDLDWRARLTGGEAPAGRSAEIAAFDAAAGSGPGAAGRDAMHRFLAATPARLVAVQIEDILGLEEQANLPGTVHEHPNWRRRLPVAADALGDEPATRRTARLMAEAGRCEEGTEWKS